MAVVNRKTKEEKPIKYGFFQRLLYRSKIGGIFLRIIYLSFISKISGLYMDSFISRLHIKSFIKKNGINMDEYELIKYKSFNDFFTRKIKDSSRKIAGGEAFISPCDSKLSVYKITEDAIFKIKESYYRVEDLLKNKELAEKYLNGYCLIFRLGVDDYHRYCYIDDGYQEENISIKGTYHTVQPIALEKYNFYKTNHREYTVLHTKAFKDVVEVEVGALMVGKIVNHYQNNEFKRGQEKGFFKFGGSTIVLLVEDIIKIDDDILYQSSLGNEIMVKYGEQIGVLK